MQEIKKTAAQAAVGFKSIILIEQFFQFWQRFSNRKRVSNKFIELSCQIHLVESACPIIEKLQVKSHKRRIGR